MTNAKVYPQPAVLHQFNHSDHPSELFQRLFSIQIFSSNEPEPFQVRHQQLTTPAHRVTLALRPSKQRGRNRRRPSCVALSASALDDDQAAAHCLRQQRNFVVCFCLFELYITNTFYLFFKPRRYLAILFSYSYTFITANVIITTYNCRV